MTLTLAKLTLDKYQQLVETELLFAQQRRLD